jgi:hypothetical protein
MNKSGEMKRLSERYGIPYFPPLPPGAANALEQ